MSLKQENGEFREVDIYMKIVSFNYPEFLRDGFFIYVSIHLTNQFVYSETLAELRRVFEFNVLFLRSEVFIIFQSKFQYIFK